MYNLQIEQKSLDWNTSMDINTKKNICVNTFIYLFPL